MRRIEPETSSQGASGGSRFVIRDSVSLTEDVIACCGDDMVVSLYDLRQKSVWRPVQKFQDAKDSLNSIDWDHKRKILCCGGSEGVLRNYDLRKQVCLHDDFHGDRIMSVECDQEASFTSTSIVVGVMGNEEAVKVWDIDEMAIRAKFRKKQCDKEYKIDTRIGGGGGGKILISGSECGEIYVWDRFDQRQSLCVSRISEASDDSLQLDRDLGDVMSAVSVLDTTVFVGRGDGAVERFEVV